MYRLSTSVPPTSAQVPQVPKSQVTFSIQHDAYANLQALHPLEPQLIYENVTCDIHPANQ